MYAPPLGFVVPFLFLLTIAAAPTPPGTHPLAAVGQTLVVSGSGRRERALALTARYAALGEEGAPPLETVEGLHGGELELLSEDAEQRWIVYKTSPRAARASGIGSVQLWDWREGRIGGPGMDTATVARITACTLSHILAARRALVLDRSNIPRA